jgi:protein-disulfide isomerase
MGTKLKLIGLALTLVAGTALAQTKPAARNWNTTVTVTPQGTHVLGNPAAKIRLTQYVSYTCPHCAHFEEQADAQLRLTFVATGKGAVEVRNIIRDPIDLTVALLTNCGPTAKFFGNHAAFLRGQDKWIGPLVNPSPAQRARWTTGAFAARTRAIAKDFNFYPIMGSRGYTARQIDACLADEALAKRLAAASDDAANKQYVNSTPSFAIDGDVLAGTHSWAALRPQLAARMQAN